MIKYAGIEGGAELAAVLRALPDALAKNALNATARAGATTLQRTAYTYLAMAMKSRSPRDDDVIIKKRRGKKGEDVQAEYGVGPPTRKPWLRWLHDGTKPHVIERRRAKVLAGTDTVYGQVVNHPGQPGIPWLRQAQFTSMEDVMKAMAAKIRPALAKQTARLVSQKYRGQQLRRIFR